MAFNDDEPVADNSGNGGRRKALTKEIIVRDEAPLEETKVNAVVRITAENIFNDRLGADIVAVLDVSGSMKDDQKLEKLKVAMEFFIRKFGAIDRLSIVTFSDNANRLCPLRKVNKDSLPDIEKIVKGLVANGNTNITAGLQIALQVLNDRRQTNGRKGAIMLMSDGAQNRGGDARQVPVKDVPVHTFGFGKDFDVDVLSTIARNSNGGTFSVVDVNDLNKAFAQSVAGLLTIGVEDLQVTISPVQNELDDHKPTIQNVVAGNYPQTTDAKGVTVHLGDLYAQEVRRITVEFLFPAVAKRTTTTFRVICRYNTVDGLRQDPPLRKAVLRTQTATDQKDPEEVVTEMKRLETTGMMKESRVLADGNKLDDAREKLVDAHSILDDTVFVLEEEPNKQLLEMLKTEVQTLKNLMKTADMYKSLGRAFALASEISHERQRFASRGFDDILRLFATPRMDDYLQEAKEFDQDPNKTVTTADEDVQEEIKKNPFGPIANSIDEYLEQAIFALQSIRDIIKSASP